MGRELGGHTPLGKSINTMGAEQVGSRVKRKRTRYGIIKDVTGKDTSGEYIVIVQFFDEQGKSAGLSKPIPLSEDPLFLAANYGSPKDLINRYWCKIDFEGPSMNRGTASIIRNSVRDKEEAGKSNELQIKGAAFAPPGSGLF